MTSGWSGGEFALCESVSATGAGPWCIRRVTSTGLHSGGGIDTDSLCGWVKAPYGWDLDVEVSEYHLSHACPRCLRVFAKPEITA